jgi:hypothetical protein
MDMPTKRITLYRGMAYRFDAEKQKESDIIQWWTPSKDRALLYAGTQQEESTLLSSSLPARYKLLDATNVDKLPKGAPVKDLSETSAFSGGHNEAIEEYLREKGYDGLKWKEGGIITIGILPESNKKLTINARRYYQDDDQKIIVQGKGAVKDIPAQIINQGRIENPGVKRVAWEQTLDEYSQKFGRKPGAVTPSSNDSIVKIHKAQVEQALSEGKPVPAEVLKDYPDLLSKEVDKKVARSQYRGRYDVQGIDTPRKDATITIPKKKVKKAKHRKSSISIKGIK